MNESLFFGKPMLVVHAGGDRLDMAKRVEYYHAGKCLDVEDATPFKIREDTFDILTNPEYQRSAQAIRHSYRRCNAGKTAAELMIRLAKTRKPILRKVGSYITLERYEDLSCCLAGS